jgi:hypothetical protein
MKHHAHYWNYLHAVWDGRTANEVGVLRYCACGVRQMAFTKAWRRVPNTYDLGDVQELKAVGMKK